MKELEQKGEKDVERIFEMLKEKMPMPDEHMKEEVLRIFTCVLSM